MSKWQPYLYGNLVHLRPLVREDFATLFAVASDPLIWEQHPDRERYRRERFRIFFESGLQSAGALVILDAKSKECLGSSRFVNFLPNERSIEIGFTFLKRSCWARGYNSELKDLMSRWAFSNGVDSVRFTVGAENHRSRVAVEKLGAKFARSFVSETPKVEYRLSRDTWFSMHGSRAAAISSPDLKSTRMQLRAVSNSAEDVGLYQRLMQEVELHRFLPTDPPTLEASQKRIEAWAYAKSPDGSEIWLNWLAREAEQVVAHFQAGIDSAGVGSVAYVIAREKSGQGRATEGLRAVIEHLENHYSVHTLRAWSDTRNLASHRVLEKEGFSIKERLVGADFFKGESSDEFVFERSHQPSLTPTRK